MEENSPVIFFDDKKIKKVMVCENRLADLEKFGFTKETIEVIRKKVKFNYGWGYLDEYFVTSKTDEEIYSIIKERKIQAAIGKILASPEWSAQIEKKAKEWNIPYEQVLRMDGQYVVDLDEKAQKEAGK
ncbi:MAG: hypothetical protein IPJ32_03990 [Sphingobacteriaceae bacterium]|nr:hypothetical protein [Sphingobacteriaceae bacterium]